MRSHAVVAFLSIVPASSALLVAARQMRRGGSPSCVEQAASTRLHEPATRDEYGGNLAQYLVDLHDARSTFDFCGGMMFQLVLSDKLRSHLSGVADGGAADARQPTLFDAATNRMARMPGYRTDAQADNVKVFHGREVRSVPTAEGGMGFVLHLSLAGEDPEGWTPQEVAEYNGWEQDSRRTWRNGERLESEGFGDFRAKFGGEAFTLHHRFYLHLDPRNQLWLSAEDGCEGQPAVAGGRRGLWPF